MFHKQNLEQKNAWPRFALNCTKFGKLILRKIINIVATRCHILKLKCTKFDFGWGFAYSAPPNSLAGFKGPTFKRKEGREMEGRMERKERGKEGGNGKRDEKDATGTGPPIA